MIRSENQMKIINLPTMKCAPEYVEHLSVLRYQSANGQQLYQKGYLGLYVKSPFPKTHQDFVEHGMTLSTLGQAAGIMKVTPDNNKYGRSFHREYKWFHIPRAICEKFIFTSGNNKNRIECSPIEDGDELWRMQITLYSGTGFPTALSRIWRHLEPAD